MQCLKPVRKKRRKTHSESIMHDREHRRQCYLCMLKYDDFSVRRGLERHHVMFGQGRRDKSEADGLTVYLCHDHHYEVHHVADTRRMLCALAQEAYEKTHTRQEWMERYKRNYRED